MRDRSSYYPIIRRIITMVLILVIVGGFMAIYYLIYLPQEHASYNSRTFRILREVANNFSERLENYGTVYSNYYITKQKADPTLSITQYQNNSAKDFDSLFKSSFKGDALNNDSFYSAETIRHDSILFDVHNISKNIKSTFDTSVEKPLSEIIEPIISIHSDVFESVLLIQQTANKKGDSSYDLILYGSERSGIANINTDSLFKSKNIEEPVVTDLDIEGISYKIFLLPFKMNLNRSQTYVLAGIVPYNLYRSQSESIPVYLLLTLCFILIAVLLALPFLKIFFLSIEENIRINDVRAIITVIFIVPFFVILTCAGIWLSLYNNKEIVNELSSLQNNVQQNFYKEISDIIQQVKLYDKIAEHPSAYIDSNKINNANITVAHDLKDVIFYPTWYKNVTNVHWINDNGNDIAAWGFTKIPAGYFKLTARDYFRDIKYKRGFVFPSATLPGSTDTFSLQPVVSKFSGDYTINLAMPSNAVSAFREKPTAIALSTKMYSIYNTVVPKGYAFCIVDEKGNIIVHSDTARSLQENILEESNNNAALQSAINHKDSVLIPDVTLYENSVKMIIRPLPNLPYYLITYYNKRGEYLSIFHIIAFVFVCEAALLLFVTLFSYCMMISGKKNSKLFFTTATLNWLRPSADKKNYYIKNSLHFIISAVLVSLLSVCYRSENEYYLYALNAAALLPLFTITGYHIIKQSRAFFLAETVNSFILSKKQFLKFLISVSNIFLFYVLSIVFFKIIQSVFFFSKACEPKGGLKVGIWILIIVMPFIASAIAALNFDHIKQELKKQIPREKIKRGAGYLSHFVISLLLAVTLISVLPTLIFVNYAFREEKTFQFQSLQIDLAKKIQQRRNMESAKLWQTKLNTVPFKDTAQVFINELKFKTGKGIYLLDKDSLYTLSSFGKPAVKDKNCLPFYKLITQYLFLPPDHDEFYDDSTHNGYYYWSDCPDKKNKQDTLTLYYKNTTENRKPAAFALTAVSEKAHLFDDVTNNYLGILSLIGLCILGLLFYRLIFAVAKRIFLIDFFKYVNITGNIPDEELQKHADVIAQEKKILGIEGEVNFTTIRQKENEKLGAVNFGDSYIIESQLELTNVYESIWNRCSEIEKYTLYDFAIDGFTNYKKVLILYQLYKQQLLIMDEDKNITLPAKSFRNFLITKEASPEIKKINAQGKRGNWNTVRTVFYVILIAVAIFIFLSQEEASKRLITIVTSLGALIPAMLKLFDKSTPAAPAASTASKGNS